MTDTPAYLSQQVYEKLITEGYLIEPELMTVVYEEGEGGILRTVVGYVLATPGDVHGQHSFFLVFAPIRYVEGRNAGARLNSGGLRTKLLIRASRIITIKGEANA